MSNKDSSCIPKGYYCYSYEANSSKVRVCKYWSKVKISEQESVAVCSFLEIDETDESCYLLGDQVKCCGQNEEDEEHD